MLSSTFYDDQGIWSFTTEPLPPDYYSYHFTVDGIRMPDPANGLIKPGILTTQSAFSIPGEQAAFLEAGPVPHGEVRMVLYQSAVVGKLHRMHIYFPPGYETGQTRYPVVYLLHGGGDDDLGWITIGRANFILDTGENMAYRPFSVHTEPEFLSIIKLMRESDVTYTHLETNLGNSEELAWAARGAIGGAGYLIAEPRIAEDLKWAGVDIMSLAQNHSMDWGAAGLLSTIKACNKVGIVGAGTGRDLEEARGPVFLEKDKGRVALVSSSSGNSAYEWAGLGKGSIPGRPGVNPLRAAMKYEVDHATAEQYKAGAKKLGVLSVSRTAPNEFNITPGQQAGATGFSSFAFVDGDKFEISTIGHPKDIEGNLRSIDEAKQMADLVMVAHHNSLSEGARGDVPCKFARAFAKAAIDAGADIYIGHGWHKALGIEIYKNKPMIHGVGDFFWQSSYIARVPPDEYESYGYSMDALTTLTPAVGPLHPAGDEHWAYSAVYQLKFENKKLTEIRLYPIELGMDISGTPKRVREVGTGPHPYLDGRPQMAFPAVDSEALSQSKRWYVVGLLCAGMMISYFDLVQLFPIYSWCVRNTHPDGKVNHWKQPGSRINEL